MRIASPTHSIEITRTVATTPDAIYAAWTDQDTMSRWLGKVAADVRIGGRYRFESPAESGKTHVYTGEYLVLDARTRVKQSFLAGEPDPSATNPYLNEFVEIRLQTLDSKSTKITFVNGWDGEPLTDEAQVVVRAAWSQWLDRMESSLSNEWIQK
jgi:uncharacterized protein YndB with AHSA1/START domain